MDNRSIIVRSFQWVAELSTIFCIIHKLNIRDDRVWFQWLMKILRVAQKTYPDVIGGVPYHVEALSRDQASMGHDVTIATVHHDKELPKTEERDGYRIRRFDPVASPLGNDLPLEMIRYLKHEDDIDVLHAHSHLYFSTNLAAVMRRFGDTPLAITNHGLYSQSAPESIFHLYLRTLGRWTFNRADLVFCYTNQDVSRLRDLGVSSPTSVVQNGVDTSRFDANGPAWPIDSDGPVLLFVGRLVEGKRPLLALEAFQTLRREFPDATFLIAGDGPLRSTLMERVAAEHLSDAVEFLGEVNPDDMPRVYRSADVLVLTSRAEGVPRTVMEALAAEVPVVCSDLPQVREAFGDRLTYVTDAHGSAFAAKVEEVLAHSESPTLDDHYRWEKTVEETTDQLEYLVEVW